MGKRVNRKLASNDVRVSVRLVLSWSIRLKSCGRILKLRLVITRVESSESVDVLSALLRIFLSAFVLISLAISELYILVLLVVSKLFISSDMCENVWRYERLTVRQWRSLACCHLWLHCVIRCSVTYLSRAVCQCCPCRLCNSLTRCFGGSAVRWLDGLMALMALWLDGSDNSVAQWLYGLMARWRTSSALSRDVSLWLAIFLVVGSP